MDRKSVANLEFNRIVELLCERINTDLGKERARNIHISSDIEEVLLMQEETSEAQKIILEGTSVGVHDLKDLSAKLRLAEVGAQIDPASLLSAAQNLKLARQVSDKLSSREDLPILSEKASGLYADRDLEERILDAIISEDEISDNASPQLRKIRREIQTTKEKIKNKLNQMVTSDSSSKFLQDSIITQRQDRYVIPVKAEYRSNIQGIVHDTSSSGATIFVEPMVVVEMNNQLRILGQQEKDEIDRILTELSNLVGGCAQAIRVNQDILSMVDFILGKGKFSVFLNGISPKINQNKVIRLKNARHPLLDVKKVVPLNLHIGEQFSTLVITGPNTGGKTVTLKTVGLFALMTQAGLHLPCDFGSSMYVFDDIFSDIGDEQSISQNLSTFSSHMVNIVRILKNVSNRSLLLLDELGSGTDPDEGSALAISILEFLKQKKATTIATTHYSNLKNYALNTQGVENASVEFDVETLGPTYRLLIGVPGKSNAFYISRKLGLGEEIIEQAKLHLSEDVIQMEDILLKIERDRHRIEKEKESIHATSENIKGRLSNLERKEKQLETNREKILKEAKKEAQRIVNDAKRQSEEIVSNLREIQKNTQWIKQNEIDKLRKDMGELQDLFVVEEELIATTNDAPLTIDELEVGATVYISSFQRNASIISVNERKKQAVVQMDNMKINVPIAAMGRVKKESASTTQSGAGKIYKRKAMNIQSSVDLRGMDLEQAMDTLTKYLDDAYLSNMQTITIIHGMGTGVLKKGVEKMLKSIKYIKSSRSGSYGEGGQGVTIVNFK